MFLCLCLFLRLVSSIHAIMATTAGVIVVSSCRGNVINDRLDFMSLIPFMQQSSDFPLGHYTFLPVPIQAVSEGLEFSHKIKNCYV